MTRQWFNFSMGFANDGCDGDTVRHILGVLSGLPVHVEGVGDVVVDTFDQDEESSDDTWPVYLTGWLYDDTHVLDNDFRGAPVRIPLANSRITIH